MQTCMIWTQRLLSLLTITGAAIRAANHRASRVLHCARDCTAAGLGVRAKGEAQNRGKQLRYTGCFHICPSCPWSRVERSLSSLLSTRPNALGSRVPSGYCWFPWLLPEDTFLAVANTTLEAGSVRIW